MRGVGGEKRVTKQRKEKEIVAWCLLSPENGGQYGIYQVSLMLFFRKQKKLTLAPTQPFLQPLAKDLGLLPRVLRGRERHGWQLMATAWCWHMHAACQAPPSMTLLWPESAHSMTQPWPPSIFPTSEIAAYILGIGKLGSFQADWEDIPDGYWINSANRRKKNMWAQGDFLTIYQIGGIVYFPHISQRVHLWAPFTTSNRQVGRDMAVKIRRWLINGLATGFNTQIYNYLYIFFLTTSIYFQIQTCF